MNLADIVFFFAALLIIGAALIVVFSRNIIYSAFALLGTFGGVAVLYILLSADFLAAVQVLIYVGGINVLFLFAVMMTSNIQAVKTTNRPLKMQLAVPLGIVLVAILLWIIFETPWQATPGVIFNPNTQKIGFMLLTDYLFPFEYISFVLLMVLVGAVFIARRESRPADTKEEL